MRNAIFFIVIITSLYYQNEGINRTQLKNGKKYLNYPKKKKEEKKIHPTATQSLHA